MTHCRADELDIVGKCFGIKITKRKKGQSDLIQLFIEDDEIYHPKEVFAAYWIDDLVSVLNQARDQADTEIIFE